MIGKQRTQTQLKARNKREGRNKFGQKTPDYHQQQAKILRDKAAILKRVAGEAGQGPWWRTIARLEAKAEGHLAQVPHAEAQLGKPRGRMAYKPGKMRGSWR